jgi:hypothetical protein
MIFVSMLLPEVLVDFFDVPESNFEGLFNDIVCSLISTVDQEQFPYQAKNVIDTDCYVLG